MTRIPQSDAIVREAALSLGLDSLSAMDVRTSFDELLSELSTTTLALYEQYEEAKYAEDIAQRMISGHPTRVDRAKKISKRKGFRRGAFVLLKSLYPDLRSAFLSVAQSRKARGGKSFEKQFELLLESAGYSFKPQVRGYRTDLVFPSEEAFDQNRVICVVASLKRTLRERWQEVVGELTQLAAPNVYLVTADPKVSKGHVKGICDDNPLHLVVWDEVKQEYPSHPRVLGFTEFVHVRLAQLEAQWESAGLS